MSQITLGDIILSLAIGVGPLVIMFLIARKIEKDNGY